MSVISGSSAKVHRRCRDRSRQGRPGLGDAETFQHRFGVDHDTFTQEGAGADDFESTPTTLVIPVTWPPPCRGTIVVPTVTAPVRVEEQADRARNVPLPESNPCLHDLFLMTNGCLNARKERCATEV